MQQHTLFFYALDPTHIGAGGYRLGRVDNTVLRDAGSQLPKIPGSSISGACRSAALYSLPEESREQAMTYARETLSQQNTERTHRGGNDPVAQVFGFAEGDEAGKSQIGMVSFRDAHIFAFPVSTMNGPRWVTTVSRLNEAGCKEIPVPKNETEVITQEAANTSGRLNLGWLLLDTKTGNIPFPQALVSHGPVLMGQIKKALLVVDENLFSSIVNANLEVRTSVAIDFETGAGVDGALFTYEAVPRGTLYQTAVCFDDDRYPEQKDSAPLLVKKAMTLATQLGLGGMTTRGFGRMQAIWESQDD